MAIFSLLNHLVDLLISPFHRLGPVPQLVLLSLISTVVLLYIFKRVSNQATIKLHKDKIFGNFLEIAIYRDQFLRSLICQGRVLHHNLLYLKAIGTPLLIMLVPMILVCLQLEYRLGYQGLKPGTSFIIEAKIAPATLAQQPAILDNLSITTSETIAMESLALRRPSTGQVFWQARVVATDTPNFITITIPGPDGSVRRDLAINKLAHRLTPEANQMSSIQDILVSGEDPIPPSSGIESIRVTYPAAKYPLLAWRFSPIVYFFILTLFFGLLLKPFMKVNI